jgi:hypothetical protein
MALRKSTLRPAAVAPAPAGEEASPLAAGLRTVAVVAGRHRRVLAAACAGAAVVVTVSALTPPSASSPGDGDRAPGFALLPAGAGNQPAEDADRVAVTVRLADPAGLLLVRAGSHAEVLAGPAADAASAPDPSVTGSTSTSGEVLSSDAVVLAVPRPPGTTSASDAGVGVSGLLAGSGGGSTGLDGVLVLAVPPTDARRIAAAAGTRALSVAVALPKGSTTTTPGWPR